MGFSITGYVLEPPRVGQSNSPFTSTPNNFISNSVAFNAAYPSSEANPRDDYLVIVTSEGSNGLLVNAGFGWTKNEVVQRFDYFGREQRFRTLPGGPLEIAGVLGPNSNTQRLKVVTQFQALAAAPFRLSIGTVGSGITQTVSLVLNDGAFGSPPPGTTELSLSTGNLNWNATDLITYNGQTVRWQQQQYFSFDGSTGNIGVLGPLPEILLNPIPGTGQSPLLRFGYGLWLQTVEVPNEGAFSTPPSGTVQWALTTGKLNFNPGDITAHTGSPVYYDGTLFARDLLLPRQSIGTVNAPSSIIGLPPEGGDLIFALTSAVPYYQFPQFIYTTTFDPIGQSGFVQVNPTTGAVQFSIGDRATYGSQPVEVVSGDLVIDHGVSMRFFRSPVNLDASQAVKDVTDFYPTANAIWQSPIIQAPFVFLPAIPIDDPAYPLTVTVAQGQGTFTGTLNRLDVPSPPAGLGYYIDFDNRQLHYAQRKLQVLIPITQPSGAVALPDSGVLTSNIVLELETGGGTNVFTPLVPGVTALIDAVPGLVNFVSTQGVVIDVGSTASFTGNNFTDTGADFVGAGVQPGDYIVVTSSAAKGVYTVAVRNSSTQLTTDVMAQTPSLSGPPTPVSVTNASYEIQRGKEILADRFFQQVILIDPTTMVERVRAIGIGQNQTNVVPLSTATFTDFVTLSDGSVDFLVAGVQIGDSVELHSGPDTGSFRRITFVAQHTVTVDSTNPFISLASETYTIERRLNIPVSAIGSSRIRFGESSFSTVVNVVPTDAAFSNPLTLPIGTVEVSQATGNLNFSSQNLVGPPTTFYWVHKLTPKTDYLLSPGLGLIRFTERLLSFEEALITYTPAPPVTTPPTPAGPPVTERATFLIRKEIVQPHPTPTNTVHFNPTGRTVASLPFPAVFRGGRPQQIGVQCTVDTVASTVTFLPDSQITNALPHGAIIAPSERVYVDYYVFEAIGGEQTTTVLQPPMLTALVNIQEGTNNFVVHGNQTANFPAGFLMRIEQQEVYFIGTSTFDAGQNQTTVTLFGNQVFQTTFSDPNIFVSSGPTRLTSFLFFPAYFTQELQGFAPVARGMNKVFVTSDRTGSYRTGTVLFFTDGLSSFTDFVQVSGSQYHSDTDQTEITLAANALRQYVHGQQILSYSVRPVFEDGATTFQTSKTPILSQPFDVFRRREGDAGLLLTAPTDFTIDQSGTVKVATALQPAEEISIFYTGNVIVQAGPRLRATYTSTLVPDQTNGLLGQILQASFTVFSPDNFYYRVETMTNFKGEVAQEIQAAAMAGSPSTGPQTSNTASPQLFQQGRESAYFQEGHLANDDIIARTSLKFFNDAVNDLEDALHAMDGRVVGDSSGRFIFDGVIGRKIVGFPPSGVLNQIDDLIEVSPFPLPLGTYQQIYLQGPFSRFFKTRRNVFTTSPAQVSGSPHDDDVVAQFDFQHLTSLPDNAFKRWPRAQIQFDYPAGTTTFTVDNANGTNDALQRPAFITSMRVVIQDAAGTFYIPDSAHVTVTAVLSSPERLVLSAGPLLDVPAGATIYVAPSDANSMLNDGSDPPPTPSANGAYMMLYPFGKDVHCNLDTGELLYVTRKFPFDGTLPTVLIPKFFYIYPIQAGDILQANGVGVSITDIAPAKIPVLFGGTTNDDEDQSVPIVGPTFDGELTPVGGGPLNIEIQAEQPVTGTLRTNTTAPYLGTGSLDVTKTIITDTNVSFPAPLPEVGDLARILTGLNGATEFRRITAVGVNTITVDSAFVTQDSGFSYTIAVSGTTIVVTTASVSNISTTLTDGGANFQTNGTQVGFTVVITGAGPNLFIRRQVTAITSPTTITVDAPFPAVQVGVTYRIDNPLDTYGGSGSVLATVEGALATELTTISVAEQTAILNFFTTIFTTIFTSANGTVLIANLNQLQDTTVNFITSGVTTSDLVYIQSGSEAGIYAIASIDSPTQITVATPFPIAAVGISYQIVSYFGVSLTTLNDIFGILTNNSTFVTQTLQFQTLVTTHVPVLLAGVADPSAFADGIQETDLDARAIVVQNRINYLNDPGLGPIAKITKALASSDRLYDKRYTWIDARINLEKGYLVSEQRAVANRIKQQQDTFNQLIKLLTVQGS